jgi:hypothetical protein
MESYYLLFAIICIIGAFIVLVSKLVDSNADFDEISFAPFGREIFRFSASWFWLGVLVVLIAAAAVAAYFGNVLGG